ncbi:unnamed protein product, partial [Rotaria sordida]
KDKTTTAAVPPLGRTYTTVSVFF